MTTKTTRGLLELQEYIDEVKDQIPEGIYLNICNMLGKTYTKSKKKEKKVREAVRDCIEIVDVEENLQEESNNEEAWVYLQMTHKLEANLKALQHQIEYKLLKKNEYNEYNFSEIRQKFEEAHEELT